VTTKKRRGFAVMDPEEQREIARFGGQTSHAKSKAHEFTTEEARQAGQKGGSIVSQDREHMARLGRMGGNAKARRKRAKEEKGNRS
jgi:general stress protein YciG